MKSRGRIGLLLMALVLITLSSCKSNKQVLRRSIKDYGFDFLYDQMKQNQLTFNTLNAKFSLEFEQNRKVTNLRGQLRIKNDSLMWMSFSPALGIEAARVLLSDDSVMFINRLNKSYFTGEYALIDSLLHTTIDYHLLQSMLVGNDLTQYDINKFKSSVDGELYRMTIRERRKIKRYIKSGEIDTRVLVQQIWLDPDNFRIRRIDIKEQGEENNNSLQVFYDDYIDIDGQLFPSKLHIDINSQKTIHISVDFSRIELNEELSFPFSIPSKYDKMIE
jgi:anthranilate/para-aminobenzoate synthase component I